MRRTPTKTLSVLACTLLTAAAILALESTPAMGATGNVAVWNDPAYADADSEGANTIALVEATGATATEFTGVTAAAFTTALADADVLVIPELEQGNPVGALEAGAETAIVDFVEGGGKLILFEPGFGNSLALLNDLFGERSRCRWRDRDLSRWRLGRVGGDEGPPQLHRPTVPAS